MVGLAIAAIAAHPGLSSSNASASTSVASKATIPTCPNCGAPENAYVKPRPGYAANEGSFIGGISTDGRFVAFESYATNLFTHRRSGGYGDLAVRDIRDRKTVLIDRATGRNGRAGNIPTDGYPSMSADGRYVAFYSEATNLVPRSEGPGRYGGIFLRDRNRNITRLLIKGDDGYVLSGDGRYLAVNEDASLIKGKDNYVYDIQSGTTTPISCADGPDGLPASYTSIFSLSDDGRYVAFSCGSPLRPTTPQARPGYYIRDLHEKKTVFVFGPGRNTIPRVPRELPTSELRGANESFSGNGRYLAFATTDPSKTVKDRYKKRNIYRYDAQTKEIVQVNPRVGRSGYLAKGAALEPSISDDGRYIAYTLSLPGNRAQRLGYSRHYLIKVYVTDMLTGVTTLVSRLNGSRVAAVDRSWTPKISGDGRRVAFISENKRLWDPFRPYTNVKESLVKIRSLPFGIYMRDLKRNKTMLVSRSSGPFKNKKKRHR